MNHITIPETYRCSFRRAPQIVFYNEYFFWVGWLTPRGDKCLMQVSWKTSLSAKAIINEMYSGGADMSDFGEIKTSYKQRLRDFLGRFGLAW